MATAFDATEWWFVRRGLPHAMPDYSATDDVWTRAAPWLVFVLFVELFTSFGDRFAGWAQFGVFVAGLGLIGGALVAVNLVRDRRPFQRPDDVGALELAAFVLVPSLLPLWLGDTGWEGTATVIVVNLVILAVTYVIVSYGLVPALRVGFEQSVEQVLTVTNLIARGLPLLLLITAFVFLNAEVWQVASDFPPAYYAITVSLIAALAMGFLALRVPREIDGVASFGTWGECVEQVEVSGAPVDLDAVRASLDLDRRPPAADLNRFERINVGMLLTISQVVQTLLVGVVTGLFYVCFGLLAVRRDTILQWTTSTELDPIASFGFLGSEMVLTWEHLAVAGFIGAFSLLQFAVSSVTDTAYRESFFVDVAANVREVLAVRAVVRAVAARGADAAAHPAQGRSGGRGNRTTRTRRPLR